MKVHFYHAKKKETACGMRAWHSRHTNTEAETVLGYRIEITDIYDRVTCQRCQRRSTAQPSGLRRGRPR